MNLLKMKQKCIDVRFYQKSGGMIRISEGVNWVRFRISTEMGLILNESSFSGNEKESVWESAVNQLFTESIKSIGTELFWQLESESKRIILWRNYPVNWDKKGIILKKYLCLKNQS